MNSCKNINLFTFNIISMGLVQRSSQLSTAYLDSIPVKERKDFCILSSQRARYSLLISSPISRFKRPVKKLPPAPAELIKDCINAVLDFDQQKVEECNERLKLELPALSEEERWLVVTKFYYLHQACGIYEDNNPFEMLFMATETGFLTRLKNRFLTDGKCFKDRKICDTRWDALWREANLETFEIGFRPLIEDLIELKTSKGKDPAFDAMVFDKIFRSKMTDVYGKEFQPQKLQIGEWSEKQLILLGKWLNLTEDEILYIRHKVKASDLRVKPRCFAHKHILISRNSRNGRDIATLFFKDLLTVQEWIQRTFSLDAGTAIVIALCYVTVNGFHNIKFKVSRNGDLNIFPKFISRKGGHPWEGTLEVKATYLLRHLLLTNRQSPSKKNYDLLTPDNSGKVENRPIGIEDASQSLFTESLSDLCEEKLKHLRSGFMRWSGEIVLKEFVTPQVSLLKS